MKVHGNNKRRTIVIDDKWSEEEIKEALTHLRSVLYDLKRKSGQEVSNPKLIEVDWNNIDEIDKAFKKLQGRRSQLKKENGQLKKVSKTDLYKVQHNAIQNIINEDLNFLYEEYNLDTKPKYYVYAHCATDKPVDISSKNAFHTFCASLGMKYMPFYIGKGTGERYKKGDRNRNYSKISNRKVTEVDKVILKSNLTESTALQYESKLIDIFGLAIHKGSLINIDEGVKRDQRRFCYKESLNQLRRIEDIL